MPQIIINKLGPIDHCELDIKDLMIFTGQQASGKSTIAKSVFFFKNVKNVLQDSIAVVDAVQILITLTVRSMELMRSDVN